MLRGLCASFKKLRAKIPTHRYNYLQRNKLFQGVQNPPDLYQGRPGGEGQNQVSSSGLSQTTTYVVA